jgi:putative sugar O-methyltransferase
MQQADPTTPLPSPPLPPGAGDVLRVDHPLLAEYTSRYRGHPAATWSQVEQRLRRQQHRHSAVPRQQQDVWQRWGDDAYRYVLTTNFTRLHDRLGLFERLDEDGLFGAETYDIDGSRISRDLLGSITELNFLDEQLDISRRDLTILDIGAGYGRLAYRAATAFANVEYLCTDAIPLSTFLSRYYLDFRGAARARVVPLDEIAGDAGRHVDVAVNIHSFSEAPISSIRWWLDLAAENGVEHLMIVPNTDTRLLSKELDGPKVDLRPLIEAKGFRLVHMRPKYQSEFVQQHGIHGRFPTYYFLFARR